MHLLAMPKDMAASTILSIARLRIIHTDAPPSSPTMFARGTLDQHTWNSQDSKKYKHLLDGLYMEGRNIQVSN